MLDWQDTIVAPATAPGPGPNAILRVTGPKAHSIVRSVLVPDSRPLPEHLFSVTEVVVGLARWSRCLDATLYLWPEGRSHTGQPAAELHVPNSPPLIAALEAQLLAAGARRAGPGEFTLRALLSGRLDLEQAEAVLALIEAEDPAQLKDAIDQRAGGLSRSIEHVRSALLDLLADLEANLDFAAEDISILSDRELTARLAALSAELDERAGHLAARSVESTLPVVLLLGPANAGKSSLFNALLELSGAATPAPAVVSPTSGTTRDLLRAPLALGDVSLELWDSAGFTSSGDPIALLADRQRERRARSADLILWCVPADGDPMEPPADLAPSARVVRVRTKRDLSPRDTRAPLDVSVSSLTGAGMGDLCDLLARELGTLDGPATGRPSTFVSHRCRAALDAARAELREAQALASAAAGPELVAVALRVALDHLDQIGGAILSDDLLDRIFSRFCIGK